MRKTLLFIVALIASANVHAQKLYPFQNPSLDDETRIDNLISQLTVEEKINCLGSRFSLPRLGIRGSGNSEGLHGLSQGGLGFNYGPKTPTSQFPQAIGLAKVVFKANSRTVLLLTSSFPFAINWAQEHLPAIVQVAHGSQETGNGVADVLFGDVNPAGRLVQTWPHSIDDLPPMMDYDIRHGRTYMYGQNEPLYPFGFGLSYTTFSYANLRLSRNVLSQTETTTVSVDITNSGKRDGEEVVQIYVKGDDGVRRLKGFKRVAIESGKTRTVSIDLRGEDLALWN